MNIYDKNDEPLFSGTPGENSIGIVALMLLITFSVIFGPVYALQVLVMITFIMRYALPLQEWVNDKVMAWFDRRRKR